jgi:hydroxyacyl-ACP dehydratase HTD2-like protein with hotdog domain
MLRLLQINAIDAPSPQLQLTFNRQPDPVSDGPLLLQWLQRFAPVSRLQMESSLDLVLIRFYYCDQPFYLHAEHYSESCWIDTDSRAADMLLSELHRLLAQDLV